MAKINITCSGGNMVAKIDACGGSERQSVFSPLRIYEVGNGSLQIVGADGKAMTFSEDDEIILDGSPITAQELQNGLADGSLCRASASGSDCCADVAEILAAVNNQVRTINLISAEVTENNLIVEATQPIINDIAACCAANTAALADLLQLIQCGENPVPQIASVDGVVTSSNTNQVGSLLTINGFNFTSDFSVVFSDAEIQITSSVFVSSTEIRVGVIGGSNVGTSDVNIISNFPDGCPETNSGTSGVGLVETIDIIFEAVSWLGNAPNVDLFSSSGLTKVSGGSSWTNGGAYGSKCLNGDGYLEFVIPNLANNLFMIGLNPDASAGANWTQLNHAVYHNNGTLRIYEQGQYKAAIGSYTAPITVRITVSGTVVSYSVAGDVKHISDVAAIFPLCPDATMFNEGSLIATANIYGIAS